MDAYEMKWNATLKIKYDNEMKYEWMRLSAVVWAPKEPLTLKDNVGPPHPCINIAPYASRVLSLYALCYGMVGLHYYANLHDC